MVVEIEVFVFFIFKFSKIVWVVREFERLEVKVCRRKEGGEEWV